jgi:oxygen-independent coproporphyrinogen-3 oxidase
MLYIHIPFCQQRCIYCDFYSTTHSVDQSLAYVQAVANEMRHRRDQLPSTRLSSVYIGGGTPSLLPLQAIQLLFSAIRSNFTINENAEITFEANPDDINSELLDTLISVGVNRISLGVQSFNDKQLQILHRRHSSAQAIKAVQLIHRKGIHHISIDLIYGQPHQTVETWRHDLRMALSLPIDHLSAYALSVEGKTPSGRTSYFAFGVE